MPMHRLFIAAAAARIPSQDGGPSLARQRPPPLCPPRQRSRATRSSQGICASSSGILRTRRGISRQRVPCGSAAGRLVIWTLELGQSTCRISRSSGRRTHARSGSWALAARTLQGSARRGSTAAPRTRNSKCKCGPVALPVAPTRPITVPTSTRCPTRTVICARWA